MGANGKSSIISYDLIGNNHLVKGEPASMIVYSPSDASSGEMQKNSRALGKFGLLELSFIEIWVH